MNCEGAIRQQWLLSDALTDAIDEELLFVDVLPAAEGLPVATIRQTSMQATGRSSDEHYVRVTLQICIWDDDYSRGETIVATLCEEVRTWSISDMPWSTGLLRVTQVQRAHEADRWRWDVELEIQAYRAVSVDVSE